MLFTTWTFAALLVATLIAYFMVGKVRGGAAQVSVLLISSLIFYAYETPELVLLLLFSILANSFFSIRIIRRHQLGESAMPWVAMAVVLNLLVLGFFKYAGFLAGSLLPDGVLTGMVGRLEAIPLPIGISFYTFQAISLVVDLHRGDSAKMTSLAKLVQDGDHMEVTRRVGFFIAFFPQLIAGPIVKAHDFFYQIGVKTTANIDWEAAVKNLVAGFFLKMVVADNLKEVTVLLGENLLSQRIDLLFLTYGYSCQIFADFAGYSLIAIGLAGLFGYRLPVNFNFPYISGSITEFWRRWHISLSTWLKEYLYIPLGGNRRGAIRTYVNLFLVMLLGGLWHGAAWSYVIWGGAHGIFLAVERLVGRRWSVPNTGIFRLGKILVTVHLVTFLWLLFLLPDFSHFVGLLQNFAGGSWEFSPQNVFTVAVFASPIVLYHLWAFFREMKPACCEAIGQRVGWWGYALLLFFIVTNSGTTGAFVYFQF
ncbi:MAG: MBOAT family O-acyltransferase [Verrucomicrobiaceae bacterium]